MHRLLWIGLGMLIGAAALGVAWSTSGGDAVVRVTVLPHENGTVEIGLQQRNADGQWSDLKQPPARFLSPGAESGKRLHSSEIIVPVETPAEAVANVQGEYLRSEGAEAAAYFPFEQAEAGAVAADTVICVVDLRDEGVGQICDGLADAYPGAVERVENENSAALAQYLNERFQDGANVAGIFATSLRVTQILGEAMQANDFYPRLFYWIELIDPHLPSSESIYCVIGHGGAQADLFWGLAGEAQQSALAGLDVQLRAESYAAIEDQVQALRRCHDDGAAAVATTLSNPAALGPAVSGLHEAEIPVISYNSGAEAGEEVRTALHISLDDRQGGRIAGEEFNRRGFDGNILCIIHEETNVGLEERCDGLDATYAGPVERFRTGALAAEDRNQAIIDRLSEGGVEAILALSVLSAFDVEIALWRSELDVPRATFGFSLGTMRRVASGRMLFAVPDHPELQSYLASSATLLVDRLRIDPMLYFNGARMLIEPMIFGAEEMQAILDDIVADR